MNCAICHEPFEDNDRVVLNRRVTFIFKPADVPDVDVFLSDGKGGVRKVAAGAVMTPEALAESRAQYTKTEMSTVYATIGKEPLPEDATNVRHVYCGVHATGAAHTGAHAVTKHAIRFKRTIRHAGGRY